MAEVAATSAASAVNTTMQRMTLVDWLDDLAVRFLVNLPTAELSSIPRMCFQIEEAQWFYEDFIRPANPNLPSLNLRQFLLTLFQHCPLLQGFDDAQHVAAYEQFLSYKTRVPVRGAIILDDSMDKVLLVKGWKKGASWSFPRGKINKDEPDLDCAIREVYEETGFDMEAAGLVKTNIQDDGQVKAIDVNMNQQHMKLFVFRGVALDTYFEPKTRKEISKIQWYNVKDLPGFKKQKGPAGHGQGEAQSSKFYMVAPFMGHLKKWIGQQRRSDAAAAQLHHTRSLSAAHDEVRPTVIEDEGETEPEGIISDAGQPTDERSADKLKALLSIGGTTPLAPTQEPKPADHTNNLLAMLKGSQSYAPGTNLPHTPFEQIDPMFPAQQPQTPQPHHPRQPSAGLQQSNVPHFPYSPQRASQQQQGSGPALAPGYGGYSQQPRAQIPGLPPHMQQPNRQPGFPGSAFGHGDGARSGQYANAAASSFNLYQETQSDGYFNGAPQPHRPQNGSHRSTAPLASPMQFATGSTRPPDVIAQSLQESHKPIGSEIPEASKLPALTTQSKILLDAFKQGNTNKPSMPTRSNAASAGQRASSVQQAALLELFKKPGASPISPAPVVDQPTPASPTLTDVTVKPSQPRKTDRKATLNEITRTLPPKKSPSVPTNVVPAAPKVLPGQPQQRPLSHAPVHAPVIQKATEPVPPERPQVRGQLFDPANPKKSVHASQSRKGESDTAGSPKAILQRSTSQQATQAPRVASPKASHKSKPPSNGNGQPAPAFSILQRPGSAAGKARLPTPQSPLRHEAPDPTFRPQLLTKSVEPNAKDQHVDKKDHLLGLFAKAPVPAGKESHFVGALQTPSVPAPASKHDHLLGLLNGSKATPPIVPAKTPEPPPAPQLMPERKPSSQATRAEGNQQQKSQQLLLNLFQKPTTSSAVSSPGTPISPFTLGTPISRDRPPLPPSLNAEQPRSRLGSVTSAGTPTASGQGTPTSATPTNETKGFLLDYLNGVVQKEGYKGAKRT